MLAAWTLNPPMACTDCGVRPRWPITGISASTIASIIGSRLRPPSSLTVWAPGSDQRGRVAYGVVDGGVVAQPRQVTDHQRTQVLAGGRGPGPGPRPGVMGDVVDRDLQRVVVAQHHHRQRVADQDEVDAGGVGLPPRAS